jgi:hypothetical protein
VYWEDEPWRFRGNGLLMIRASTQATDRSGGLKESKGDRWTLIIGKLAAVSAR